MANELTDLELGEWSICIDPANEDSTIEIVKSKSGLAPVLKETDMSDRIQKNDEGEQEVDQDFAAFADEHGDAILNKFSELSEDDQAAALIGMEYENSIAAEFIKSLSENVVPKEKYDELKKSATLLMERVSKAGAKEDEGLLAEVRKSLAPGQELSPEAVARIEAVEKAQAESARKDAIAKAKTYGFGKAEDVADLETRIRKALGDKDADAFAGLVKQAGALAKSSPLFKSVGEDAGNLDANDPIAKAKVGAEEIRKANPGLTPQQAQAKYWDENPTEYAAYRAQQRAA